MSGPGAGRQVEEGADAAQAIGERHQSTTVQHPPARAQVGGPWQTPYYALSRRELKLYAELDGERHQVQQLDGIAHWSGRYANTCHAGIYTLNRVRRRSTWLPLKKLALHVAENFI